MFPLIELRFFARYIKQIVAHVPLDAFILVDVHVLSIFSRFHIFSHNLKITFFYANFVLKP